MFAPTKVLIRADAGPSIGTGHFARVSAIADILASGDNIEILILTNADGVAYVAGFFPEDAKVVSLTEGDHDLEESVRALDRSDWNPDIIILDQYGMVPEWEKLAIRIGAPLLVFDDFDVAVQADVIVRPQGGGKSTGQSTILRGPAYLPLSRHVTDLAGKGSKDNRGRLRLNVCFGGSDPTGETAKTLQAIADLGELNVDVVIGPGTQIDHQLIREAEQKSHVTLHHAPNQAQMAQLMDKADLALGAGGVMLWERLCLGVPSLVISIAENQDAQINAMVSAGAIRFLGKHNETTPDGIVSAIEQLAADRQTRQEMAEIGRHLVDGRGAYRLSSWARALTLGIRKVELGDARNLLDWRTDDRNWRYNFEPGEKPDYEAHLSWLTAKLNDPGCIFRIVTLGTEPVGVVRFDIDDHARSAYLSIYLVPDWHGYKLGLPVFYAAERELRGCGSDTDKIVSRIHRANTASEKLHRDAGFVISGSPDRADWFVAEKTLD